MLDLIVSLQLDYFGALFLMIAGLIIGLGAVTVIDIHGFLGRTSKYWTEATTRTHKVTKPLIWLGIAMFSIGALVLYRGSYNHPIAQMQAIIVIILILNGLFLSFKVSPFLLEREKHNKDSKLLPKSWQRKITLSFIVSFIGWWSLVLSFVATLG